VYSAVEEGLPATSLCIGVKAECSIVITILGGAQEMNKTRAWTDGKPTQVLPAPSPPACPFL